MSGLGEQIAVLDGLTIAPGDGNYGGGASYPDAGRWPLLPSSAGLAGPLGAQNDLEMASRVFASASGGANYSGGSAYPDDGRFPVWAQGGAGMAGFGAAGYPRDLPNVAPRKRVFASPSGGANYGGGSSYPDSGRFPVWTQPAGMAGCACGMGLGTLPNVLPPSRVFVSASGGAQYSGGSTYPDAGRFPITGSYVGLADARMAAMTREQLMTRLQFHTQQMANAKKAMSVASPAQRMQLSKVYNKNLMVVCIIRSKVGLPTLPECQTLLAKARVMMAKRRR